MSSILEVRVDDAAFRVAALRKPWALRIAAGEHAVLYAVRSGSCWLQADGHEPERLRSGSIISLPGGGAHALLSSLDAVLPTRATSWPFETDHAIAPDEASPEDATIVLAARVPTTANPLPDILPTTIHVPPEEAETSARLNAVLDVSVLELSAPMSVHAPVLRRLSEVLAIELIEFSLNRTARKWKWRTVDDRVRRALRAMHTMPDRRWTLTELAAEARLSRSAFSDRFRDSVGDAPLRYLTSLRMQRAAAALRDDDAPIYEVASSVGYGSEAAFSKAFRRTMGASPAHYRRRCAERERAESGSFVDGATARGSPDRSPRETPPIRPAR